MFWNRKKATAEIYELLEQELQNDLALQKALDEQKNNLRSNTQVCEEEGYDFRAGRDMPQTYQCGGIANAGKYMRVDTDGYIRPLAGQGGGGEGYEPDFKTIGLTSNNELSVIDYISLSEVNKLLSAKQDTLIAGENITIEGNVISATGGGTLLDYVVSLRASGYSLDYSYYEKGIFTNASIYLASVNGTSVLGKYDISIPVVSANPTTQPQATLSKLKIDDITYSIQGGGGTTDYNDLTNKPSINKQELVGDKTSDQLNLVDKTNDQTIGGIKTFNGFQTRFDGLTQFRGNTNLFTNGIYAGGSTVESTEYKVDRINVLGVDEYGEHIKRTLMLPFKNDTIATLGDIPTTGYTAGKNIEISEDKQISAVNVMTTNTVQTITGSKHFGSMVLGQDGRINYGDDLPNEYFVKYGSATDRTLVKLQLPSKPQGTYTFATQEEITNRFIHTIKITNIPAKSPYSANAEMSIIIVNSNSTQITDGTRMLANINHFMSGTIVDDKKIGTLHVAGANQSNGLPFYDGTSITYYDLTDFVGATFQDTIAG